MPQDRVINVYVTFELNRLLSYIAVKTPTEIANNA